MSPCPLEYFFSLQAEFRFSRHLANTVCSPHPVCCNPTLVRSPSSWKHKPWLKKPNLSDNTICIINYSLLIFLSLFLDHDLLQQEGMVLVCLMSLGRSSAMSWIITPGSHHNSQGVLSGPQTATFAHFSRESPTTSTYLLWGLERICPSPQISHCHCLLSLF